MPILRNPVTSSLFLLSKSHKKGFGWFLWADGDSGNDPSVKPICGLYDYHVDEEDC